MTIEELQALSKAELKELADQMGVPYTTKTTISEFAELIHEKYQEEVSPATMEVADETDNSELLKRIEELEAEKQTLSTENSSLKTENGSLKSQNETLTNSNQALLSEKESLQVENGSLKKDKESLATENESLKSLNSKLEDSLQGVVDNPHAPLEEWDDDKEFMKVRVRIVPNKGIYTRMRAGFKFSTQYSVVEVNKEQFENLINDQYLKVEGVYVE